LGIAAPGFLKSHCASWLVQWHPNAIELYYRRIALISYFRK